MKMKLIMSIAFMGLLLCVVTICDCCNYSEIQKRLNNISSIDDEKEILKELHIKINNECLLRPDVDLDFYIGNESCSLDVFHETHESNLSKTIIITILYEVSGITISKSVINYSPKYPMVYFILFRE